MQKVLLGLPSLLQYLNFIRRLSKLFARYLSVFGNMCISRGNVILDLEVCVCHIFKNDLVHRKLTNSESGNVNTIFLFLFRKCSCLRDFS